MRFNLKVPYAQKDAAKELGARWDAARKIWYVMDPQSIEVFSDWMPQEQNEATGGAPLSVNAKFSNPFAIAMSYPGNIAPTRSTHE